MPTRVVLLLLRDTVMCSDASGRGHAASRGHRQLDQKRRQLLCILCELQWVIKIQSMESYSDELQDTVKDQHII